MDHQKNQKNHLVKHKDKSEKNIHIQRLQTIQIITRYITIFHGQGELEEINKINCLGDNIYISNELVPERMLENIISSSFIGIVLYRNNNKNDMLTAFSSEKMARLLQSGIPIIAFNNISYRTLMNEFRCGVLINSIGEIPIAIHEIKHNYSKYQDNCYNAFDKYYNYNRYKSDLSNFILNLEVKFPHKT